HGRLSPGGRGAGSALVDRFICQHDLQHLAWRRRHTGCAQCRGPDGESSRCRRLHVRVVALAERKPNAELWVQLRKFLQADELVLTSCSRAYVQRNPKLVMRNTTHHDVLALLGPFDVRPARAGPFFSNTDAFLLLYRAMGRRYRDSAMRCDEGLQELGSCICK